MRVVSPSLFKRNFPRDNRPFKDKKVGLRRQKYNFLSRNKASDGAKCEGPNEIFRIFGCVIGAGVDAYFMELVFCLLPAVYKMMGIVVVGDVWVS